MGADDSQYGFRCIDIQMGGAAPHGQVANVGNLRWCAFQFSQDAVTGGASASGNMGIFRQATPTRAHFNRGAQIPNGDALPCGWAQEAHINVVGNRVPHAAVQRIGARCSVTRHASGEKTASTVDLKQAYLARHPAQNGDAAYNTHHKQGLALEWSTVPQQTHVAKNLKYELKCLYEFGEQQYLFKNDGSKPVQYNNILADSGVNSDDPRLKRKDTALAPPMNSGITYS